MNCSTYESLKTQVKEVRAVHFHKMRKVIWFSGVPFYLSDLITKSILGRYVKILGLMLTALIEKQNHRASLKQIEFYSL